MIQERKSERNETVRVQSAAGRFVSTLWRGDCQVRWAGARLSAMIDGFAVYAIAHEAGHAVVGQFVRIGAPVNISFYLRRGSDGRLYLGDFATALLFPSDVEIARLPEPVKNCLCYTLAAGLAATQFSGLSFPNDNTGLDSDRERLSKLTSRSLDSFVPSALAVIKKEERAYREVISQCTQKYEQLKSENVAEGKHILLDAKELKTIFNRNMSPLHAPLHEAEDNAQLRDTMSAHEAGHATLGITLGARVEAVYAIPSNLPNGKVRINYSTKFGSPQKAGLDLKDRILLTAGAAAGEFLLNGGWEPESVERDRADLEELGAWNFDYCVETAIRLLRENISLLTAVRDKIRTSMFNFKQCKVARKGTHIILAKGSEVERLYGTLGFRITSSILDLDIARDRHKQGIS
jgi:hypothetical protein